MGQKQNSGLGWLTRDEMAAIFGVETKSFDAIQRKLLPAKGEHIRTANRRPLFHASTYITAWRDRAVEQVRQQLAPPPGSDAEVFGGPDSPMLEKVREETWRLKKLEREEREKNLLPRDKVHGMLGRIASLIRSAGENMQKAFGEGPREMLDEALNGAKSLIDEEFS